MPEDTHNITKRIAIIGGGGWYGTHLAWTLANKYPYAEIDIYEKNADILSDVSGRFGIRLHTGAHYAESDATRYSCQRRFQQFKETYPNLVVGHKYSIYAMASVDADGEPPKVSDEHFTAACQEFNYLEAIDPTAYGFDGKMILSAHRVDEPSIRLGQALRQAISNRLKHDRINIYYNSEIKEVGVNGSKTTVAGQDYDHVINTTCFKSLIPEQPPFEIEFVYQVLVALIMRDKQGKQKPISVIFMDGMNPCIMPVLGDEDKTDKYIMTHARFTTLGSYKSLANAREVLSQLDDTQVREQILAPTLQHMQTLWPAFSDRFEYSDWRATILPKVRSATEFRRAMTFRAQPKPYANPMIYVFPGKVAEVFDVETEVTKLIDNQDVISSPQGIQYVSGGALDVGKQEILATKHALSERNTSEIGPHSAPEKQPSPNVSSTPMLHLCLHFFHSQENPTNKSQHSPRTSTRRQVIVKIRISRYSAGPTTQTAEKTTSPRIQIETENHGPVFSNSSNATLRQLREYCTEVWQKPGYSYALKLRTLFTINVNIKHALGYYAYLINLTESLTTESKTQLINDLQPKTYRRSQTVNSTSQEQIARINSLHLFLAQWIVDRSIILKELQTPSKMPYPSSPDQVSKHKLMQSLAPVVTTEVVQSKCESLLATWVLIQHLYSNDYNENHDIALISIFINTGVSLQAAMPTQSKNADLVTPLIAAITNNRIVAAQMLIEHSNIDAQNNAGENALHLAIHQRQDEIISALLDRDANIQCINSSNQAPLLAYCMSTFVKGGKPSVTVLRQLLAAGAGYSEVNHTKTYTEELNHVLYNIIKATSPSEGFNKEWLYLIRILLLNGANPHANIDHNSAFLICKNNSFSHLVTLFEEAHNTTWTGNHDHRSNQKRGRDTFHHALHTGHNGLFSGPNGDKGVIEAIRTSP